MSSQPGPVAVRCANVGALLIAALTWSALGSPASAQSVLWFRAASAEGGELKLVEGVPVLSVQGSPEEIGRQEAALTSAAISQLSNVPWLLLTMMGRQGEWNQHLATTRAMFERFPAAHRQELEACAKAAGVDRDKLIGINVLLDVFGGMGCSSLIAESNRSATGAPLFGRNVDMFSLGILQLYNLVTAYRPTGKHAFVTVGFPGVLGAVSGMNDQGLSLAVHGVFSAGHGRANYDPQGTPCTMLLRRVLEDCGTTAEAEQLLRQSRHTTALSIVLCDRQRGAVAEVSPGGTAIRHGERGLCFCTNHFRAGRRLGGEFCPRYAALRRAEAQATLSLDDVARKLHEVNQGSQTLQTMVFEPGAMKLHVALGALPSSGRPLKTLDVQSLLSQRGVSSPAADAK